MMIRTATCAAAALLFATAALAVEPFTVHDLVRLERVADPRLSPDERYIAYQLREADLQANRGVHGIWLLDLAQKKGAPRRLTPPGVESNTPRWGADGRLYFLSTRSGSQQVWRIDLAGGEAQPVTAVPLDVGAFRMSPDGRRIALSLEVFPDCADLACTRRRLGEQETSAASGRVYDRLFVRHWDTWKTGTQAHLFSADLDASGKVVAEPRRLTSGIDGDVPTKPFGGDEDFVFAPDGATIYFVARIAGRNEASSTNTDIWRVPSDAAKAPENVTAAYPGYDFGPILSPDGRTLAWRSMARPGFESDRQRIMLRDIATGATRELAARWDRSPHQLAWSPDGKTLYAVAADLGHRRLFAINVRSEKVTALTGDGTVESFDAGEHFIAVARDDLKSPAQVYTLSPRGGRLHALTRHNVERLAARQLGDFEQFSFKGWNDEIVYGYVVKPVNLAAGQKAPVAFVIHGGPQTSMGNHWHYRWNPQTYAGAGYAVVFIDFHGSDGYGQAFTDSISGDWGGKPLVDLQKGWTAALAKYPFLDAERACALGASYGGYMVNWIAGNWAEPFKCLVNHDGVFDNRAMAYGTEELWFIDWEMQGAPYERPTNLERHNPVNHVASWKTPMLVIQGGRDYRIPETQGLSTFTALQRRGIESRLLYFPNENHWVLKPHNSIQWHETVEAWLNRWLKPPR